MRKSYLSRNPDSITINDSFFAMVNYEAFFSQKIGFHRL